MEREVAGKDLETLTRTGRTIWNDALGKIQVKGNCEDSKTIFYTSLYRTYERMVCLSEDGQYYIDFDRFRRDVQGCKLLILSNPHNPGGRVWTKEELLK